MPKQNTSFKVAITPILFFFCLLVYGLFIHPQVFNKPMLPVEVLVLMAFLFNAFYLLYLGYDWDTIHSNITKKVGESIPIILILISVGVLIGSWVVSGTIPMLIYYGISIISASWIYLFSFLICVVFSLLTGTSWGSAGTIGVVMLGIAQVYSADLAITTGAIVGGSFFGDKMSPLSDTTNIAALATNVPVYDHIHSMMYTTVPSAILAALIYAFISPGMAELMGTATPIPANQSQMISDTLDDLATIFNFNILLFVPVFIVLWGSFTQKPIILTLLSSAFVAMVLAFVFQPFGVNEVFNSFNNGFNLSMIDDSYTPKSDVLKILNRGGLYNLIAGVMICFLVFALIGTLEVIDAIDIAIKKMMTTIKTQSNTIVAALTSTLLTNIMISNQYATSFVIGSAFSKKFDQMKINRKVLSRSIEDAGTMIENLLPWTPSGLFMIGALGVSSIEYAPYQFLSLINIVVAYFFAFTGIACFYDRGENLKK